MAPLHRLAPGRQLFRSSGLSLARVRRDERSSRAIVSCVSALAGSRSFGRGGTAVWPPALRRCRPGPTGAWRSCTSSGASSESESSSERPKEDCWNLDFTSDAGLLIVEYDLPTELPAPREALADFFHPLRAHIRTGPVPRLAGPALQALRNAVRVLFFLDELEREAGRLMDEGKTMEAIVLLTTHWHLAAGGEQPLLRVSARRTLRDRMPAIGAVSFGLMGPLAWIPGVLGVNEVIMRRVDMYGALKKSTDGYGLGKAVMRHHIFRMIYDKPRLLLLDDCYSIQEDVTGETLVESLEDGSYSELVTGTASL